MFRLVPFTIGSEYEVIDALSVIVEMQTGFAYGVGLTMAGNFSLGAQYNFVNTEKLQLGPIVKVGYEIAMLSAGTLSVLPGYTPPVIVPAGTFREGDDISASISGLSIQGGLSATYWLLEKIGLACQVNWNQSFLGELEVQINPAGSTSSDEAITLKKDDVALVKNDGSSTQAGINPTGKSSGLVIFVGAKIKL